MKVLTPGLTADLSADRFEREIQLAARLQHPNIVPVIAAGETEGLSYFTMPYIRGESLRQRLASGPLPLPKAVKVLADIAQALTYAPDEGIVHRDIKPDNVLLTSNAAVVTDFGIARAVSESRTLSDRTSHQAALTEEGTSLGTPAYMAREQVGGEAVDARTDLYAWGLVTYEVLAGRHPFADRTTAPQLMTAQLVAAPGDLATLRRIHRRISYGDNRVTSSWSERNGARRDLARPVAELDGVGTGSAVEREAGKGSDASGNRR